MPFELSCKFKGMVWILLRHLVCFKAKPMKFKIWYEILLDKKKSDDFGAFI